MSDFRKHRKLIVILTFLLYGVFSSVHVATALNPEEILVIANSQVPSSVKIARYYMAKRGIPPKNLLMVNIHEGERCTRSDYKKLILYPVKRYLLINDDDDRIRCIVTVYGIPLVIRPDKLDDKKKRILGEKRIELRRMRDSLEKLKKAKKNKTLLEMEKEVNKLKREIDRISETGQVASVDSELSLARFHKYPLDMWLPNPYFVGYENKKPELHSLRKLLLMVSRLDGPDSKTVERIIDDSIAVEKTGLRGVAYFDARYPKIGKSPSMYGKYDLSIRKAAEMVHNMGIMKVVLDIRPKLFEPGTCPDAALYCGWYSLAKYVDAFSWVRGSVGYHIASAECVSLHRKNASYWCLKMLEKGVAATLGPVAEPYLRAFPPPELFFKFLLEGKPLVEAYFLSKPFVSWRMVLIGDPLYTPFRRAVNKKLVRGRY